MYQLGGLHIEIYNRTVAYLIKDSSNTTYCYTHWYMADNSGSHLHQ